MGKLRLAFLSVSLIVAISGCSKSAVNAATKVNPDILFNDPHIHYMGRIGIRKDAAELTWTASSIVINFNGTGAKAVLQDKNGKDFLTIVVDDKVVTTLQPGTDKQEYTLVADLPSGVHKLEIFKRTEYDMGILWFYGLSLNKGGKLLSPPNYAHTIEYFGDSITCGYAIEDTTGQDRGTYEYENGYKSYANITARYFNADYNVIAKSGIGVMLSWFNYVMPDIYDKVYARGDAKWDFTKFTPEVVVINLFQNDSWLVKAPDQEQFKAHFGSTPPTDEFIVNSYKAFISSIRSKYPKAKIICALGSMDATKVGSPWPGYVQKAVAGLNDKAIYTHFFPFKNTPGHPSEKEQKAMANNLIAYIKQTFSW
ncbi:electron transporter RnfD [Inquilinus sp. KBS0705]|nr:electron transporter RnfD [Inquilinus sp. KBS0705]